MFFCNFLFLLRFCFYNCKCRRYFFLFLSKGLFKRFFYHKLLFFLLCLSKCFCLHFFLVATLFFILVKYALLFPFVTERFLADFSTAFSPKTAYFLPFCDISLAVHVHCKKIPLVVLGNCRFILQFFFCNSCSIFYNLLLKIKNFHIKNAVTTVFFHGHHGNFISFYVFLYTICFTGRMKYNTSSLLFIVITQLLCWANCIFMASAFITLRQSLRYFAL